MALIKSISGIRGTIGGPEGDNLTGVDIVKFTSAYAQFIKNENPAAKTIVVGRDARVSGPMVSNLVEGTLMAMGLDVINIGLATTPTTELAVVWEKADGGIIITASHNPAQWNALKLLNAKGEFLNDAQGKEVLRLAASAEEVKFVDYAALGKKYTVTTCDRKHIEAVLNLPLVDKAAIEKANFTVAVDAVNSVGGVVIPQLLRELGVKNVIELNCEPTGKFAHTPEPIPENLTQIADLMKEGKADVGIVVDPDVDRLALVMENGEMFVEEYTLVAVADYVLANTPGNTVSNLSSSRALRNVTARYAGCEYNAAAVGEVNVVTKMKETNAIIGGEGNGGVIYPELHYGRDALVGVALFLTLLAKSGKKMTELKSTYPAYAIAKNKIQLTPDINVDAILDKVKERYANEKVTDIDGVKIDFAESWVHLRKSNTEPIIRIYSEAATMAEAEKLGDDMKKIIASL
jgi:phosphomannomutase